MNQKGFSQLILMVIVGVVVVASSGGIWYYQQLPKQNKPVSETQVTPEPSSAPVVTESSFSKTPPAPVEQSAKQNNKSVTPVGQPKQQVLKRDDFGCFSSCSANSNQFFKQMCETWKAGKTVQWPPYCGFFSSQPGCVKLCETENKAGTQSNSPQTTDAPSQKQTLKVLSSFVNGEFASGVSEDDKNLIIQGVLKMDFYLQKWFGKSINKPAGLRVGASALPGLWGESQVRVENGTAVILLETGSANWSRMGGEGRRRLSAHEYVHVYQFQNGCGQFLVPQWFAEGEAEWLSYKLTQEVGWAPSLNIPQTLIPEATQVRGLLKSDEWSFTAYPLYTMAIDYLMKDKPLKALDDFCVNLADGKGMGIPKAFETAFGISLDKFYEEFESYRNTWPSGSGNQSQGGDQSQIPQGYSSWADFCKVQPQDSRCAANKP